MQLYQLKPSHKLKSRKRIGRGGKRGTYSGKGIKGQKSRAGKKPRPGFAGGDKPFFKQFPKQRGIGGSRSIRRGVKSFRLRRRPVVLNLKDLDKEYQDGQRVSPKSLLEKGLIVRIKGSIPKVKILGQGELAKKLNFQGVQFSKSAKEKTGYIEKTVELKPKIKPRPKSKSKTKVIKKKISKPKSKPKK